MQNRNEFTYGGDRFRYELRNGHLWYWVGDDSTAYDAGETEWTAPLDYDPVARKDVRRQVTEHFDARQAVGLKNRAFAGEPSGT